jgi:hypothetical protein
VNPVLASTAALAALLDGSSLIACLVSCVKGAAGPRPACDWDGLRLPCGARDRGLPHNSLRSLRSLRSDRMRQVRSRSALRARPQSLRSSASHTHAERGPAAPLRMPWLCSPCRGSREARRSN